MTGLLRWGRPMLLLAGLAAAGLVVRFSGLGDGIRAAGEHGPLVFLLGSAAACAVGVPRQVVAYAAGLAFGAGGGTALALAGEVAGAALSFLWARTVARAWTARFFVRREHGRLARMRDRLLRQPFVTTLTLRLLPVGNSLLLSVLAGTVGVPAGAFLAASAVGFLPQTVVFALLGDGVQVDGGVQVAVGIALFILSALLGMALMRRGPVDLVRPDA